MGGEPWMFITAHAGDPWWALARARQEGFEAGEYRGAEAKPATPEAALEAMGEEGTASILDIMASSEHPALCAASPVPKSQLIEWFGTSRPTRRQIEDSGDLWESIDRGEVRYIVLHGSDGARGGVVRGVRV